MLETRGFPPEKPAVKQFLAQPYPQGRWVGAERWIKGPEGTCGFTASISCSLQAFSL